MDMDKYDGPTVAVLVRTMSSMFGTAVIEVVSVHPDADAAALGLARQIVAGEAATSGWRVVTVPAPALSAEPLPTEDEARPLIPTDDEAERYKMSKIVGLPTDQITPSWRAIRAQARRTRDLGGEAFVSALRNALAPAQSDPTAVRDMGRPDLLNLVRTLVEVANTPPAPTTERVFTDEEIAADPWVLADLREALEPITGPGWSGVPSTLLTIVGSLVDAAKSTEPDPERLERAARPVAGSRNQPMSEAAWASYDGNLQEGWMGQADRIVRAYLTDPADWDR